MSDGMSDYRDQVRHWGDNAQDREFRPIVPRIRIYHGRMMWAEDLGLPTNKTPPYHWLGREAEAA